MTDVVYLILLGIMVVLLNIREIYLFKKGMYWPYLCGGVRVRDRIYTVGFLSYLKLKDPVIIYQTLVLDVSVIALIVFMKTTFA